MKRRGYIAHLKKEWMFHVMLVPAVILLLVFSYFPMVGIVIAFQDFVPSGGFGQFFHSEWVGFENFRYIFGLADFRRALVNTLVIAIWKILTLIVVPLILALLLNEVQNKRFKKIVQTVIYIPYFLSWVILGGILVDILSPTDGIVNKVITLFGGEAIYFLGDLKYIRGTMIVSNIWKEAGYNTVIFLAALTSIDMSQYEAARIDGAGFFQQFWYVTLPNIKSSLALCALLRTIDTFRLFEKVNVLTGGGPAGTTTTITQFLYTYGIRSLDFGFGSAGAIVMTILVLILSSFYIKRAMG